MGEDPKTWRDPGELIYDPVRKRWMTVAEFHRRNYVRGLVTIVLWIVFMAVFVAACMVGRRIW
jgi:hypothetical protein